MLGKRSRPISQKLICGIDRRNFSDESSLLSPGTPTTPRSPRKWENKDCEGIGLGIVAALSRTNSSVQNTKSLLIPNTSQLGGSSNPIPISPCNSKTNYDGLKPFQLFPEATTDDDQEEIESSEDYTCVISHGPTCIKTTVYYQEKRLDQSRIDDQKLIKAGIFCEFSVTYDQHDFPAPTYPSPDFLKFCHLCKKKLQGEDIYMYRGEKAFCSMECRYMQMMNDDHRSGSGSGSGSGITHPSPSPCSTTTTTNKLFSAGIVVS